MRFTLIKDLKQDTTMKPILNGLLLFISIYIIVDVFVKQVTLGLFNGAITNTLLGNVDEFIDPINKSAFLELIHSEIFFLMMLLLTLSAVFIRVSYKKPYALFIMNTAMISGLLTLITLALSYFVNDRFINLYIISFFTWHIFALYMSIDSFWKLNFAKSL